jgi:hypothetical protein
MNINNRFLSIFLVGLLIVSGLTVVYIFSTEDNRLSGVLCGVAVAFVSPLVGFLVSRRKKTKAK